MDEFTKITTLYLGKWCITS